MSNDSGSGAVAIVAIVVLVIGALFFFLPMMKTKNSAGTNEPRSIDLNVNTGTK